MAKYRQQCSICGAARSRSSAKNTFFPLLCGDGLCRACLAHAVRVSLSSRVVPVKCCMRPIPDEFVRAVLDPEENAYYTYLVGQTMQGRLISPTPLGMAVATTAFPGSRTPTAKTESKRTGAATRTAGSTAKQKMKSKVPKVVINVDDDDEDDLAATEVPKANPDTCHVCKTPITDERRRFVAPCKHVLCRDCIIARCHHAISNAAEPGGIGVPVRCCNKLLSLGFVQVAINARSFAKYKKLFDAHAGSGKYFRRTTKPKRENSKVDAKTDVTLAEKRKADADSNDSTPKRTKLSSPPLDEDTNSTAVPDCVACLTQLTEPTSYVIGPCKHPYCLSCFSFMAKKSLEDRAMVPVRCCGTEFPDDFVALVLPHRSFQKYARLVKEKTPGESTLKSDKEYAAVVKKVKGKQCPACGIGVQKISGCQWMRCSLGHGFCWNCGKEPCACH